MKSKEKRKVKPRFYLLKRIATCSIMFVCMPFLFACCWMAILLGGIIHAHSIADSMTIPIYPDSQFLYEDLQGYNTVWKVYCTLDNIETVLDYYKHYESDTNYRHYVSPDGNYQTYTIFYSQSDLFLDFAIWIGPSDADKIPPPSWTIFFNEDENRIDKCVQGTIIQLSLSVPTLD